MYVKLDRVHKLIVVSYKCSIVVVSPPPYLSEVLGLWLELCISTEINTSIAPEYLLAGADNFAVEHRKAQQAIAWINEYAKKNNHKFECGLAGYSMETVKFGSFEIMTWSGDWSAARNIIQKASKQLRAKLIESGYHEKRGLLSAMFGNFSEYGKVYSNGKLVGRIEMNKKEGRWVAKAESYV